MSSYEEILARQVSIDWERSLVGRALVARTGKFLKCNQAYCNIVEYSEPELQSMTFQDITHWADRAADVKMANEVAEGKREFYDMKKRYITKFGKEVTILLRVDGVFDHEGIFLWFSVQILEMKLPDQQKHVRLDKDQEIEKKKVNYIKDYWQTITLIAVLVAEIIRKLLGL